MTRINIKGLNVHKYIHTQTHTSRYFKTVYTSKCINGGVSSMSCEGIEVPRENTGLSEGKVGIERIGDLW